MTFKNILFISCAVAFISGCGTIPASGPYSKNMDGSGKIAIKFGTHGNEEDKEFKYAVADVNPSLLAFLERQKDKILNFKWPANEPVEDIKVNVGDTIQVSIFESQAGGLFIPEDSSVRPGNFVSLPAQTIGSDGAISVPYAGEIIADGKTTEELSELIEARLKDKAIEPQVVVSFANRSGAEVSVIGNVNQAQRLSLGFNKYKVLDAIATAGGPASPGFETKVSLQREGEEYTIPFEQLVLNPEKNIYSKINDTIYLYREPETFTAYGAVQIQGNVPFGKRELRLSEALGLTRGLRDTQADPAEVYIYRQRKYDYFTNSVKKPKAKKKKAFSFFNSKSAKNDSASDVAVSPSFKMKSKVFTDGRRLADTNNMRVVKNETKPMVKSVESEADLMTGQDGKISLIFKVDMRNPNSFFLAQNFKMEDQDVIYVANAESVEFVKFLNILNLSAGTTTNTDIANDRF